MSNRNYGLVRSEEDLERFVNKLLGEGRDFAFDVETGYTGPLRSKGSLQHYAEDYVLAGVSFTNNPDWARYAALGHDNAANLDNLLAARQFWRLLRGGFGVAHNGLMELSSLSRFFRDQLWDDNEVIPLSTRTYSEEIRETEGLFPLKSDTMLASMLLAENKLKDLKTLSREILGEPQVSLITLFTERGLKGLNAAGKLVKYNQSNLRFNVLPLDPDVVAYGCEDSAFTLEHHYRTYDQIKDNLIFRTELKLTPILVMMEREGLLLDWAEYERRAIDVARFKAQYAEYVMERFSAETGEVININLNSPAQVATVLFSKMGIKPTILTDAGAPSTGEKAMRSLKSKYPVIGSLLQYREVAKLLSAYIEKYLKEFRYDRTGRAHPSHKQEGAGTGRFSVDGVSYQQWPKPYHYELPSGHSLDLNYRNFLIAPEGWRIIGFDYANVELRIVAGLANERAMLDAFEHGIDIHKQTASTMLKVPLEDVTDKQRSVGKTLNFAIVYGSGADNIATLITSATGEFCSVEQAESYLEDYYRAFPDLAKWMDERRLEGRTVNPTTLAGAAKHYVTTMFGRRIPIFEYESEFRGVRAKGDRNAVNGPVQGAAADYMKIAMVRVDKEIKVAEQTGLWPKGAVRLIMTVHDALEFYVRNDVDTATVIAHLEPAISYKVKGLPTIKADWHEGYRWGSVAEIDRDSDGKITYKRKLELPDKTKHSFSSQTLDELVEQIEKFWADRTGSSLEAKVLEELDFEYDDEEDEWVIPENTLVAEPSTSTDDEPVWLHSPGYSMDDTPMVFTEEDEVVNTEPLRLELTLAEMPTTENWPKFKEFIAARPGRDTLTIILPEGSATIENVSLKPAEDEVSLQLIFGTATLALARDESTDALAEGLAL